jgi:hypothetical protein
LRASSETLQWTAYSVRKLIFVDRTIAQSPVPHSGGLGSIAGHVMWDFCALTEILTENLPNTSLERYSYTNDLDVICEVGILRLYLD